MRRAAAILGLVSLALLLASCGYSDSQRDLCHFWHSCTNSGSIYE